MGSGFTYAPAYTYSRGQPSPRFTYLSASLHCLRSQSGSVSPVLLNENRHPLSNFASAWTVARWCWNINQLCIDYASRPRLSSRLTLGGLAFPRNPWTSGGGVSHPSFATHANILTRPRSTGVSTTASVHDRRSATTPYCYEIHNFGSVLEPRYIIRAGSLDQ